MAGNYLPVRPDWLALGAEPPIDPAMPIVDAHHHLWDRPGFRFLLPDLLEDIAASGHAVGVTCLMQGLHGYRGGGPEALRPVGETEFAAGLADGAVRACAGIVGYADLRLGQAVAEVLEAHVAAGRGRFRGVRQVATWDADPTQANPASAVPAGLLGDAAFRAGFAKLGRLGLSFDAWVFHPQIDEVTALARAFPGTAIVLDHCGGPLRTGAYAGRDAAEFGRWERAMRALAGCGNVCVKLGGLGMRVGGFGFHTQARPPSSEQLARTWRPWVDTCIEAFGAGRCMFESNFPVDKGSYSYGTAWNAFKRLTAGAAPGERQALFGGTATRIYQLEEHS